MKLLRSCNFNFLVPTARWRLLKARTGGWVSLSVVQTERHKSYRELWLDRAFITHWPSMCTAIIHRDPGTTVDPSESLIYSWTAKKGKYFHLNCYYIIVICVSVCKQWFRSTTGFFTVARSAWMLNTEYRAFCGVVEKGSRPAVGYDRLRWWMGWCKLFQIIFLLTLLQIFWYP